MEKKEFHPVQSEQDGLLLRLLYQTIPGRFLLKGLTAPALSKCCGRYLDSGLSKWLIPLFLKSNHIDLSEYEVEKYGCFNDCFCRRILPEKRPIDQSPETLIAPCDGLLSVYPIDAGRVIPVKQSAYTIAGLLKDSALAESYVDGLCLVFRLCVDHFHRYDYVDDGMVCAQKKIPGVLHTVRPVALAKIPVFTENAREYIVLQSPTFGPVVQMEVGAMLVGKIANEVITGSVSRGEEKGHFLYGGSTVILLLQKDAVEICPELIQATQNGLETPVRLGEAIGQVCVKNNS